MVVLSEAKVVCEYCGAIIRKEKVYSATTNRLITTTFDLCLNCKKRFVPYDNLAITFAIAKYLGEKAIPDQIMMRDFAQRSSMFIKIVKARKISDPREVFSQYQNELAQLAELEQHIAETYDFKYKTAYPLLTCIMLTNHQENPFIQYREYIHKKYKKLYHP